MISLAATILTWANACFIVALTVIAYRDALQKRFHDVQRHLRLAGTLAIATAALSTVILYENRSQANEEIKQLKSEQTKNASWNTYPQNASTH